MLKVFLLALLLAACAGSETLEVTDAWAGSTPVNAENAAIYLTIDNDTSAEVSIISVTSERCAATEIHETTVDDQEVMRMRPASSASLTLHAGSRLEMKPGGVHVMCLGVIDPFDDGDRVGYSLELSGGALIAGEFTVEDR